MTAKKALAAEAPEDWGAWRARVLAQLIELGCPDEEAVAEARRAEERMKARLAWLDSLFVRMFELYRYLGDYWNDFFDAHPELDEEDPDPALLPPDPPEQAELEAIERVLEEVRLRDQWPRHLYFDVV
jgi:hypothetical protein